MAFSNSKMNINLDLRFVSLALLVAVIVMLFAWHPWSTSAANNARTITVSGDAKVTAEPDEFVFQPSYEFINDNKDAALASLTQKSDEVTKGLKKLGVNDSKIKSNSDGYNYPDFYLDKTTGQNTYTLRYTVTVNNRELTQKVQDYLLTTTPSGQVSPQPTFSESKRKSLESQARDDATKDARKKAEQSAKNLGFKVSKVKTIEDGSGYGGPIPYMGTRSIAEDSAKSTSLSLNVQPGENDLTYSVTVTYYIR